MNENEKAFRQPTWVLGMIDNHVKAIEEYSRLLTYNEIPRLVKIKNTLADIRRELDDKPMG